MKCLKFGQGSQLRRQTLQLASLLCRWCQVREDLLFAFEKCHGSGFPEPMNKTLGDFLVRVKGGMPADRALDLMKGDIDNELFHDLITAVRFNFRYRGDLPALLEQLEWQINKIEEEFTRRRLSNAHDRRLTLLILIVVPLFVMIRFGGNDMIRQMFLSPGAGLFLAIAGTLLYLAAAGGFILISGRISG